MKLTIDTVAKTISMEEAVTLDALTKLVKKLFPEDWKEWKLLSAERITYIYPQYTDTIGMPGPITVYGVGTGDPIPEPFHTTCAMN